MMQIAGAIHTFSPHDDCFIYKLSPVLRAEELMREQVKPAHS
jgi:hypothetical protein